MSFKYFLLPNPIKEKEGEISDTITSDMGDYNGYVVVPSDHPIAQVQIYKEVELNRKRMRMPNYDEPDRIIDESGHDIPHQGTTFFYKVKDIRTEDKENKEENPFNEFLKNEDPESVIIGFDTAHYGDGDWDHQAVVEETERIRDALKDIYHENNKTSNE